MNNLKKNIQKSWKKWVLKSYPQWKELVFEWPRTSRPGFGFQCVVSLFISSFDFDCTVTVISLGCLKVISMWFLITTLPVVSVLISLSITMITPQSGTPMQIEIRVASDIILGTWLAKRCSNLTDRGWYPSRKAGHWNLDRCGWCLLRSALLPGYCQTNPID